MIKLNNEYAIDCDARNIILHKLSIKGEKSKNPGEETSRIVGYFGDFEALSHRMIHDKLMNNEDLKNITDIIDAIDKFKRETLDCFNKIDIKYLINEGNNDKE